MIKELDWENVLGQKVRVYRNLNNGRISVQFYQNKAWRVAGHVTDLIIEDVKFHVSEKARQRVIIEQCKNVHAWGQGTLVRPSTEIHAPIPLGYNPYKNATFVERGTKNPILQCKHLVVRNNLVFVSADAVTDKDCDRTSIETIYQQTLLLWFPGSAVAA